MAQEPFIDSKNAQMAWDDLRTSPAFPALVGGVAGIVGGLALMFIASRVRRRKETLPAAYDAQGNPMNIVYLPSPQQFRILGFTVGDLITLTTVGFSLFRQARELMRENELKQALEEMPAPSQLPPPPSAPAPAPKK